MSTRSGSSPKSVSKKSIAHRLSSGYFRSKHYFIRERATGQNIPVSQCNRAMLESGDYLVIQEGGEGNALGRIIFRFNNNFSIYLHDTSSRGVFQQEDGGVSHGCFIRWRDDSQPAEKIAYSKIGQRGGIAQRALLPYAKNRSWDGWVEPKVPIFITYFTLWPSANGILLTVSMTERLANYWRALYTWGSNIFKDRTAN